MVGNESVIAVRRALTLLDCFRPSDGSLTLVELVRLSGHHRTAIYHLMNSFERVNYIIRHDDDTYTLSHRLLYPGKLYEQSLGLARIVRPGLQALSQTSGGDTSQYMTEGGQCLYLFHTETSQGLCHSNLPSSRFPLDGSTISKVLHHWGLGKSLQEDKPTLPFYTSNARDPHTTAFVMPVFGIHSELITALTLIGSVSRLAEDRRGSGVSQPMQEMTNHLSLKLGASKSFYERFYGLKE